MLPLIMVLEAMCSRDRPNQVCNNIRISKGICSIFGEEEPVTVDNSMTINIALDSDNLHSLDISPVATVIENLLLEKSAISSYEQQLCFDIDYPRPPEDPRELSEIPEVRLWFIRLDSRYPWLPFLLDWKAGELARYTAMLVPHQFNRKEGIQYNPEALEIFLMQKIFVLTDWLQQMGIPSQSRLKSMGQILGYDLDDSIFEMF